MKIFFRTHNFLFIGLMLLTSNYALYGQSRDVVVHDPVMIKQNDTYFIFHTGKGIPVKSSKDMKSWKEENPVFAAAPTWILKTIPKFDGSIWAPDIFYHKGLYYLYYSVSAFGRNNSAIGVATNETLVPTDPKFKWVDHGIVVQSVAGRDLWNAIDPNVALDDEGNPWMVFGSFWMGMKLVKLQSNLLSIVTDSTQEWGTVAARERNWKVDERDAGDAANPELDYKTLYSPELLEMNKSMKNGSIEAPFIFKKNGYYYLFVSWDRCCRGLESSYKILVGRSKNIRGPYLDKDSKKMIHGGGTLIAQGNNEWAAVGHQAAYTLDGKDYLIYHAYDKRDNGKPKLRINEIQWDEDWWPTISQK
jgi:arabinan endo-1,5-alpha-L-arabinosidase